MKTVFLLFLAALAAACIEISGINVSRSYIIICVVNGDTLYLSRPDSALRCATIDSIRVNK